MSEREFVEFEPAFILHQRPYRDTSQLLECLTANHGRIGLIARGSRRVGRGSRAMLQPFVPLHVSWVRRGELGQLRHVEATAQPFELVSERLLAGFYLNELMLRLMERGDANGFIFSCYSHALADLAAGANLARTVRLFELRLLRALGYELVLDHDVGSGEPLQPQALYVVELELGPRKVERAAGENVYYGRHLISLYQEELDDEESVASAKRLLGEALDRYLGGRALKSRGVLKDIFERGLE
jgi:DNA repair protein RecO (recombination protein O)